MNKIDSEENHLKRPLLHSHFPTTFNPSIYCCFFLLSMFWLPTNFKAFLFNENSVFMSRKTDFNVTKQYSERERDKRRAKTYNCTKQ